MFGSTADTDGGMIDRLSAWWIAVADQNAIARVIVPRNLDERDGQPLWIHVELLLQSFCDALHCPAFLLDGAALQHRNLNMSH